jgi:septal ring factor EnvC (AmiA/AmiB activator)
VSQGALGRAIAAGMLLLAFGLSEASGQNDQDFNAVRQKAIAAAHEVQQQQQAIDTLQHQIELIDRDVAGRQRDLDESRPEQAHLLGALEMLALHPPDNGASAGLGLGRLRGVMLVQAVAPELRAEAGALTAEIQRTGQLRTARTPRQQTLATAREELAAAERGLAQAMSQRTNLLRHLVSDDAAGDVRVVKQAHDVAAIADLIELGDDAAERRDRQLRSSARSGPSKSGVASADPSRPSQLRAFDPPQSLLDMPVMGTVVAPSNAGNDGSSALPAVSIATAPGVIVVAPFDGRIVYAGPFRDRGLVLIMRHGDLYHSVLSGLGRVDVLRDEWVLAGEPLGAMPDAPGSSLQFEMVRSGHAVDPRPWLRVPDNGHDDESGDQKVTR